MNDKRAVRSLYVVWTIAGVMLGFAIAGRQTDAFYIALRWVCCTTFVYSAVVCFRARFAPLLFVSLAVLFNPLVQFHFSRATWQVLDIISLALIILSGNTFWKELKLSDNLTQSLKALGWLTAGVAVAAFLVVRGIHVFQVMRGGATVSGQVLETFQEERENDTTGAYGVVTIAVYEFSVSGNRFTGRTEEDYEAGDSIEIEYNPRNPTQNRAKGDRGPIGYYFILLIFGGAFSYYAISRTIELRNNLDTRTQSELQSVQAEIARRQLEGKPETALEDSDKWLLQRRDELQ